MTRDDAQDAGAAIARLAKLLEDEPRLQPELQRARREFFGVGARLASVPGAHDAAELRFLEWFVLERPSETLGDVPIDVPPFAEWEPELGGSTVSVFVVTAATPRSATARDLQDDSMLELAVPPGSLLPGDLVVGRLYPRAAGAWTPSSAAAVFRPGAELAAAFARDLQRLQLDRRLQQVEIEHLLLRRPEAARPHTPAPDAVPFERLEAELEQLLTTAGSELDASGISAQLAVAARPGQVMGPLLEELAFDTKIDLDRVRELLLQIWNAQHRDDPTPEAGEAPVGLGSAPPGETLGERLARTLEEGLAQKRDVEELFQQIGRMAGIDPAELDEPDEDAADAADEAADDAAIDGDLGPLIEEYLWETGRGDAPAADALRQWAELQQNAPVPHSDLDSVTAGDVVRLLLHVYLGSAPGTAALAVRATFAELRAFAEWVAATQELTLAPALDACSGSLLDQLDRLQAAGDALSSAQAPGARPGMLQVETVDARGFGASDDDGGDHWVVASPAALAHLRVGDLVLGALAPRTGTSPERLLVGRVVVLPADARTLME